MTDILIVDDELGIRNILSEILGEQGYRVATAANVAEAKKAVTGRITISYSSISGCQTETG